MAEISKGTMENAPTADGEVLMEEVPTDRVACESSGVPLSIRGLVNLPETTVEGSQKDKMEVLRQKFLEESSMELEPLLEISEELERKGTVGPGVERPGGGAAIQQIRTVSTRRKESLAGELQQKGVTQPLPCVIAGDHPMATLEKNPMDDEVILSLMPNVGPSAAQMLDKPHELVCKSRTPHQYPEPVPVAWNIGLGFEKNVAQALEVEVGRVGNKEKGEVLYDGKELKAQAISGPSNKKRKAPVHFIPVDDVGQPIPDGLVIPLNGGDSVPPIGSPTFAIGKGNDEDCSGKKNKKNSSSSSKKRGRPRKSSQENYGRRWNISYVCYLFGVDMGLQISSIDIVGDLGKDRLVWKRTPSGCFSAKEAYWANLQHRLGVDHKIWKRIWSCKIHPRASLFLWRICSGVLPTRDKLGNIDDDRCLLCNGAVESTKHIFFECSLTRSLWFGGPIPLRIERLQGENVMSLVLELCGDLVEEEASKLLVCGYVIWDTIWNYRNSIRLGGRCRDCLSLLTEVRKRLEELEGTVKLPASEVPTRTVHLVQRAPFNSNILVSDGSFKDGKCGLAAVGFDRNSSTWISICKSSEGYSALDSELQAIYMALHWAKEQGWSSIFLFSDCLVAVNALVKMSVPDWKIAGVFFKILKLVKSFEYCNFAFANREFISGVNDLAIQTRLGNIMDNVCVGEGLPPVNPNLFC
ncbi:hypothetical protein F8388_016610 [Cannabis sativa]|uniref:Reverse transcriptase zinc-binding domain-containing protein n=1 Tax=Cannabis sativa TaxID=3483 RepID=A0A7J6FAQ2_CANSA|nr:hypothetical protein F8388_016610 [Cannabis sativa]